MAKTKSHIIYRLNDKKTVVPGCTTVLGQLDKPGLMPAAVKLTKQGLDYKKVWENLANIGTLSHSFCTGHLLGEKIDTSDYDPKQISQAENSFLSYLEWEKEHPIKPYLVEKPLVHEVLKFGGTLDILTEDFELIDLKSGSGIYDTHVWQLSALRELLRHHDYRVDKCRVLNIPRTEDESFMEEVCSEKKLESGWIIFQHLLGIYYEKKENKNA